MTLLIGLIIVLVAFSLLRAFLPEQKIGPAALALLAAAVLVGLHYEDLARVEFWAGTIGFVAILSALLIVMHPNPMVSVLFLILNLFCVALFYLLLQAEFLAVLQVIIYAGAIMVLFVFVVMLLNLRAEETLRAATALQRWGALALGIVFAGVLFWAIQNRADRPFFQPETFKQGFGTARDLGWLLFTKYVFAFEAASVLLVAAMVGAVMLAKRRLD